MTIYFLRHEHRDKNDFLFRSNLNTIGNLNANTTLKQHLSMLNFDTIYSSPFIRTIQTITPTVNTYRKDMKINPEYAIAEYIHDKAFISCNDFILKTEDYERFPLNKEYISVFCKDRLCYKETITHLNNRTKMFSDYIKQEYHPDKTILICSHRSTLISLINNLYDGISINDNDEFGMGKLVVVNDDNRLIFLN